MALDFLLILVVSVATASAMIYVLDRIVGKRWALRPPTIDRAGATIEACGALLVILGLGVFWFQCVVSLRADAWLRIRTDVALSFIGVAVPLPRAADARQYVRFLYALPFSGVVELLGGVLFWIGSRLAGTRRR